MAIYRAPYDFTYMNESEYDDGGFLQLQRIGTDILHESTQNVS